MKRGIRRAGLAALVATTIGTSSHISSTYGEPANLPKTSPSLEERSYEDCKIAFASMSMKDRKGGIFVMNADGSGVTQLTDEMFDRNPSWSPDGKKIAFMSARGEEDMEELGKYGTMFAHWILYMMDADGKNVTRLLKTPLFEPYWSPDGERIVFMSGYEDKKNHHPRIGNNSIAIYSIDSNGENQKRLTDILGHDVNLSWFPDGRNIVYASNKDVWNGGNWEIMIMNSDGSGKKNLTRNPAEDDTPILSSDGKKIIFTSNRDSKREIYIMDINGNNVKKVTKESRFCTPLYCTHDNRIIFSEFNGTNIIDFDGSRERILTNANSIDEADTALSPDGKMLAYKSIEKGNMEIYIVNIDNGNPINLTNSPRQETDMSWSPFLPVKTNEEE